jgi:hypothetical protein
MKLLVNLCEEELTSDEDSDDELDEIETSNNDIEDKAHALLEIQLHCYLKLRTAIEKAPKISDFWMISGSSNNFECPVQALSSCVRWSQATQFFTTNQEILNVQLKNR